MKWLIILSFLLIGCAPVNHKIHYNHVCLYFDCKKVYYVGVIKGYQKFIVNTTEGYLFLVAVKPGENPKIVQTKLMFGYEYHFKEIWN